MRRACKLYPADPRSSMGAKRVGCFGLCSGSPELVGQFVVRDEFALSVFTVYFLDIDEFCLSAQPIDAVLVLCTRNAGFVEVWLSIEMVGRLVKPSQNPRSVDLDTSTSGHQHV